MANAFLNLDYENIEADIEAVKALATGPFLRQYTRASNDLVKLTGARRPSRPARSSGPDWWPATTTAPR